MSEALMIENDKPILFFDGYCNLCNRSVDFLIRRDKNKELLFASLQGETAKELIPQWNKKMNTLVFYYQGKIETKSNAALNAYASLGAWRKGIYVLKIIPKFIRDSIYDVVSRNRLKWFGKRETCRVPTAIEKNQFLD